MTAAEKAMRDIGALLAAHISGKRGALEVINDLHRVNGAYSVERIGEGA